MKNPIRDNILKFYYKIILYIIFRKNYWSDYSQALQLRSKYEFQGNKGYGEGR